MSAQALTAVLTALAGAAVILPQIVRVLSIDSAAGVAVAGIAGSVWGYLGWLVYATRETGGWSIVALAIPAALQVANLIIVMAKGGDRRGSLLIAVVGGAVVVAVTIGTPARAVWVLLAMGVVAYLPTVRSAWHAPRIQGVSRIAWTLSTAHAIGWSAHGLTIGDLFVVTNGAVNVTGSALVLAATFVRHDVWERPLATTPGLR